jgi:hypothetical protein
MLLEKAALLSLIIIPVLAQSKVLYLKLLKPFRKVEFCASLGYEVSDRDGIDKCEEGILENVTWLQQVSQEQNPRLKGLLECMQHLPFLMILCRK